MCSVSQHDAEAETGVPPSSVAGSADERTQVDNKLVARWAIGSSNVPPVRSGRHHDAEAETGVQSQAPGRSRRQKGTEARWLIGASAIPLRSVPQQDPEVETRIHSLVPGSADVWSREGKEDWARRNGGFVLGDVPETRRTPLASPAEVQADQELADMNPHTLDGWFRPAGWKDRQSDGMVLVLVLDIRPSEDRVHS